VIGILNKIDIKSNDIQAIVLTPVRELALAVAKFIKFVGQFQ
jgi:superfamily II DNA/RNA helicase